MRNPTKDHNRASLQLPSKPQVLDVDLLTPVRGGTVPVPLASSKDAMKLNLG